MRRSSNNSRTMLIFFSVISVTVSRDGSLSMNHGLLALWVMVVVNSKLIKINNWKREIRNKFSFLIYKVLLDLEYLTLHLIYVPTMS